MKILIPVDFSPTSHNAIEYAYEMANKLKVEIELLHIISKRKNFDSVVEEELEIQRLENEMTKFSRRYPNKDTEVLNVQITTLVKIGKIEEVISSVCEKNKIDLIILGTKAKHSILEYLFGSFSSLLIQTAPRPMIIVPELAEIKPIQHIAVATDEEERDQVIFLFVKALSHQLGAEVNQVYVYPLPRDISDKKEEVYNPTLLDEKVDPNAELTVVRDPFVIRGLEYYIKNHQVDLLALYVPKRKGLKAIFHRSLSKRMAFHTKTPLLIWNEKVSAR